MKVICNRKDLCFFQEVTMLKTIQHSKSSALYDEGKIHILKRNKGGYWRTTISFAT
jgi:hypothetical protein